MFTRNPKNDKIDKQANNDNNDNINSKFQIPNDFIIAALLVF